MFYRLKSPAGGPVSYSLLLLCRPEPALFERGVCISPLSVLIRLVPSRPANNYACELADIMQDRRLKRGVAVAPGNKTRAQGEV